MELPKHQTSSATYWEVREENACPLCDGIGFQIIESGGSTRARKCYCISKDRVRTLRLQSNIPRIYWNKSLDRIQGRSMEEFSLLETFKKFLHQQKLRAVNLWVTPVPHIDLNKLIYIFAADLIQLRGRSCLWLDCLKLTKDPNQSGLENNHAFFELAANADFLFVENYRCDSLKSKLQKWLEQILQDRIHRSQSTVFFGPAPVEPWQFQELFWDRKLGSAIAQRFRLIDLAAKNEMQDKSGWLF